jgi:hypothetical protein
MKKIYLDIETADGTVHEHVRVLAADKVRAARIARLSDIPLGDNPEVAELLAFAATTRAGIVAADDLDAWRTQVLDFAASDGEPAGIGADPTTPSPEALSTP